MTNGYVGQKQQIPMNAMFLDVNAPLVRAPMLRRALISGARKVIAQRDRLNKMNVFPVPDGDTGSNMAFTLGSILTGALNRKAHSIGDLLHRVSNHAIDGARGNSGAILAQFFTGISEQIGSVKVASLEQMSLAIKNGAATARQALSNPVEGTIVTVISAFADALHHNHERIHFQQWFEVALQSAKKALANTPNQLPVLMKAGVVDAGAQGFVDMLDGVYQFIKDGRIDLNDELENCNADFEVANAHMELATCDYEHRWCTECLVLGEGLDRNRLREAINDIGASCIVVAGSSSRIRLHAHVGNPTQLFDIAGQFGRVESTKADDMQAQARTAAGIKSVVIITDSAADMPDSLMEELNIHCVPLRLSFGEKDYLDKVGLSTHDFYQKLRTELVLPKTSQPSPGDFRRQFEFLLSHHSHVVYVGLSRAVSGTLQSAETAANRGHADRIHIFDTANAAGGQGLLVIAAAEAAKAGKSVAEIMAELEMLRSKTVLWAMTADISHVVRGGRIPKWVQPIVEFLGLTPIAKVTTDGKLSVKGGLFGKRDNVKRFANYIAKRIDPSMKYRLIVGHCDDQQAGQQLQDELAKRIHCIHVWGVETGPAVGAHAGPGAMVVALQPVI
ncbi:MAG TPA: DegV family protein [Arenimonas sp.]|nr:DegV family protein [Arenimonas sp.]